MLDKLKKMLIEAATSKKALAAIAGVLIVFFKKWGLDLSEDAVNQLLQTIAAYIIGQGIADMGKNKEVNLPTIPKK